MNQGLISVLVVDDDTLMREVLKAVLRDEGFKIAGEAKDGQSAISMLERLEKHLPDVVCLDLNMLGISGLETLKAIRSKFPGITVVMISGDSSMDTVREAVGYGASGFVIKPFKSGQVGSSLRAALKDSGNTSFG